MGILKSLFTLGKSFISQAEESIEETQGVRMLEQHIRDAKAELDKAGKSRVDLLARVKLSHDKLKDLRERKASLEARALEALSKNVNPSLINEVAEEIARLENLITAEEQVLSNLEVSRDGVEKAVTATAQRIAQFEQQMEVVKATEAMQRAQQAVTTSTVGASSSVSTAAESLKRLQTRQAERQARLDAAAQLEKVADGRDLDEKLAEAKGFTVFDREVMKYLTLGTDKIKKCGSDAIIIQSENDLTENIDDVAKKHYDVYDTRGKHLGLVYETEFDKNYKVKRIMCRGGNITPKRITAISKDTILVKPMPNIQKSGENAEPPPDRQRVTSIRTGVFLIGRKCDKTVLDKNNEVIVRKDTAITAEVLKKARINGKLLELSLHAVR